MGIELSIIIPTFNERVNVEPLLRNLDDALKGIAWEAIFVDDDSSDGTAEHVRGISQNDPRVRCIQRIARRGLSSASIEGMLASSAPYLAVMDGDLQHDETLLKKMLQVLRFEDLDIIVGSRYVAGGSTGDWSKSREKMSRFATAFGRILMRVDIQDLGDNKENYRWNFQIENHRRADHFDELIPFCKMFSLSGIPLRNVIDAVMDVDEWMRVFALESLVGATDTYANGSPHNLQMYASPSDHRILALPYDLDGNFNQDAGAPLWSQDITNLKKIIELPSNRRLFYGHLQEILDTTYHAAYLRRNARCPLWTNDAPR